MDARNESAEDIEEVFVDNNTAIDKDKTIQRLKEFSYYLVEEIETNLEFCLKLLEERQVPVKPNSKYVFVLSKIASVVPKVGAGLGSALTQVENFFLNRIDKKNSKTLADLVYFYNDNKDRFRQIEIEAAVETFCSFEDQFRKLTCNGGERRAMQKLAKTASGRIINYLLETEQRGDLTKMQIIKGILEGDSKIDRTIKTNEKNWKTTKIFTKTGLVVIETSTFYRKSNSHPEKYRHRKPFDWETQEEIEKLYEVDSTSYELPTYFLKPSQDLIEDIRRYIMTKDPLEEAKLERENNVEKLSDETTKQYEEILKILNEYFQEVLEEMEKQFSTTLNFQRTHTVMLDTVLKNQDEDKKVTEEIHSKLHVIHQEVEKSTQNQTVLIDTTSEIKEDISAIKYNQIEITEKHKELEKTVEERSVKNEVKEILRENDPGPRIKKEIERSTQKVNKEIDRFTNKLKKFGKF